jgi:sterol desaturase/sphingolipid hydroxylase (fatty acid hydroxylase superfamily)
MFNILLSVFCYDLWFYVSHILLHHRYFYCYHYIHHQHGGSVPRGTEPRLLFTSDGGEQYAVPTALDAYTGHWSEGPFQGLGALAPWTFMEVSWFDFAIVLALLNMRGMMRHDERFVWLIGNHHLLHHKFPRYNYGEYWLDSLFGTRYPDETAYKRGLVYI